MFKGTIPPQKKRKFSQSLHTPVTRESQVKFHSPQTFLELDCEAALENRTPPDVGAQARLRVKGVNNVVLNQFGISGLFGDSDDAGRAVWSPFHAIFKLFFFFFKI